MKAGRTRWVGVLIAVAIGLRGMAQELMDRRLIGWDDAGESTVSIG